MEVPDDLARAIAHASAVISWQENCTKEDMPPKWMWALDHELELHFDQVERDRNDRFNGVESGEMMQNEMVKR